MELRCAFKLCQQFWSCPNPRQLLAPARLSGCSQDSNINCFPVIFSCTYVALLVNLFPLHGTIKVCDRSNNLEPGCPVRDSVTQKDYPMLPFSIKLSQSQLALSSKSLLN